jgi:hypothetical protein
MSRQQQCIGSWNERRAHCGDGRHECRALQCRTLGLNCFEGRATALFNRNAEQSGGSGFGCPRAEGMWRTWLNQSSFRSGEESYAYLYHQLGFDGIN